MSCDIPKFDSGRKINPVPIFYSWLGRIGSCRALQETESGLGTRKHGLLHWWRDGYPSRLEHLPAHSLERGPQEVALPCMADFHFPHLRKVPQDIPPPHLLPPPQPLVELVHHRQGKEAHEDVPRIAAAYLCQIGRISNRSFAARKNRSSMSSRLYFRATSAAGGLSSCGGPTCRRTALPPPPSAGRSG